MKAIGIVLIAAMAACQPTISSRSSQVRATSAAVASFAPFRTFGFRLAEEPASPYQVSARSFEVERRVRELVADELVRKGYTQEGTNADFLVRISSGTAREDPPYPTTTSSSNENQPHSITTAEVVVDAFDRSTAQQVWHGTATAEIGPERINEPALQAALQQMLALFPCAVVSGRFIRPECPLMP
jgi:hypothetical protein